ncbi:MAG TPA: alanine racemase [Chthoniobacteraceae bacterium]|jgi:D-serine deaminase-like pyridoxal phosphate-dependent protein|nr:alanine racemase [Chthoniobacteraceae bacterium]
MDALSLETPFLYVDLDVLERNLRRMQQQCAEWKLQLRPHTKTHKIPEIARMQLALGARGLTVAKIGEAEVMPEAETLVAYPIVPAKMDRLRALAKTRPIIVTVDSVEAARAAGDIDTLVEVDVGFGRCGVQSPAAYEEVAGACARFRGLFYHPAGFDEAALKQAAGMIRECLARRPAEIVSGGSTRNAALTYLVPETTEIRPGAYAFNDAGLVALGVAKPEDCALRMLVSVVSTSVPGQCVIDGGSKTFSMNATKVVGGYGDFVDRPWRVEKQNEEHGFFPIEQGSARIGEKLWVIPGSAGTCVNLHDEIAYGRNGQVEGKWRVAARGRSR